MNVVTDSTTLFVRDFQLAEWRVRPSLNRLERGDEVAHVGPKAMAVLVDLAEHAGEVRSKRSLLRAVWGETAVSDDVLTHAVCELRKALEDDARNPRYIETVPRKGYWLVPHKTTPDKESFRYRMLEKLGGGGMGIVHKADDTLLGRTVALKFLPARLSEDRDAKQRFLLEARAAARLSHPNIAVVHDVGEDPRGRMFIAMDYYDGETIKKKIERGELLLDESLRLAEQIAHGLAAAHAQSIVHRDIKPANVMVTKDGQAKIVDFGLAKLIGTASFTRAGYTPGTIAYMSPEQLLEQEIDHRTDLWSLGILLCEMIAGRRPFDGGSTGSVVHAIISRPPEPLLRSRPDCPPIVSQLVDDLLSKSPSDRPVDATEVANRLSTATLSNDPTTPYPAVSPIPRKAQLEPSRPPPSAVQPPPRRRPGWQRRTTVAAGAILLAVLAALGAWWQSQRPTAAPSPERRSLLVGDFRNETGEELLDQTVREAVTIALGQSPQFTVFPRTRVLETLQRMEQPQLKFIDEATGAEIGLRENLDLLVTGSVQASGEDYRLVLRLVDVVNGAILHAGSTEFSGPAGLFEAVDALVAEIRTDLEGLTESNGSGYGRLESATTGSLEALQLYSRAADRMARGDHQGAIRLFKGALQLDGGFAMAHLGLGRAYSHQGDPERMKEHLRLAFDLRHLVTERERFLIEGLYHGGNQEYEKQVEALEALAALAPDDLEAHVALAGAYRSLHDLDSTVQEYREVVRLAPRDLRARGSLVHVLAINGAADQAMAAYEEAIAAGLDSPYLLWGLGLARIGRGELDLAEQAFTDLAAAGGTFALRGGVNLARVAIFRGRLAEAEMLLLDGIASDRRAGHTGWEAIRRHMLAKVYLLRGQESDAREQLEALLSSRPELRDRDYREIGAMLAELGDVEGARAMLAELSTRAEGRADAFLQHCAVHLEARIALAEDRFDESLALFREADFLYPALVSRLGSARAAYALGDFTTALAEIDEILADRVVAFNSLSPASWPLTHLLAARTHRELGDEAQASQHCSEFKALWEQQDRLVDLLSSPCVFSQPQPG